MNAELFLLLDLPFKHSYFYLMVYPSNDFIQKWILANETLYFCTLKNEVSNEGEYFPHQR